MSLFVGRLCVVGIPPPINRWYIAFLPVQDWTFFWNGTMTEYTNLSSCLASQINYFLLLLLLLRIFVFLLSGRVHPSTLLSLSLSLSLSLLSNHCPWDTMLLLLLCFGLFRYFLISYSFSSFFWHLFFLRLYFLFFLQNLFNLFRCTKCFLFSLL